MASGGMWRSLVSARRLGRRGRRFESGHPDEAGRPETALLLAQVIGWEWTRKA
jgi:hypothetical protein